MIEDQSISSQIKIKAKSYEDLYNDCKKKAYAEATYRKGFVRYIFSDGSSIVLEILK